MDNENDPVYRMQINRLMDNIRSPLWEDRFSGLQGIYLMAIGREERETVKRDTTIVPALLGSYGHESARDNRIMMCKIVGLLEPAGLKSCAGGSQAQA